MIIRKITVGSGSDKHFRYFLQDGSYDLACFDDLTTAGIVARFLKGSHLAKEEYSVALAAMAEWDQAQNERKGDQ